MDAGKTPHPATSLVHHRTKDASEGRQCSIYAATTHTRCCLWPQITCQFFHLACQLAWLAPSSQCKWAHSAASWQSRTFSKRMVQAWHTFKKFSLPSPNPLLCRRGWHVPNEIGGFVWENPPPLTGIVSSKTTPLPFLGKSCNFYPCLHHCCFRKYFNSGKFSQSLASFFDANGTFCQDSA